jgi:uncharacterized protein YukE
MLGRMTTGDRQQMTIPAMRKLAKDYQTNARQCSEIAQFLKSPLASMFWQSQAATGYRDRTATHVQALNDLNTAYLALSSAVDDRANTLEASGNV